MYRLLLRWKVAAFLSGIPRCQSKQLAAAIRLLKGDPRPSQAVQLGEGVYSLLLGFYRIVYAVLEDENVVLIGRLTRRSADTSRDLETALAATKPQRGSAVRRQRSTD